MKSLARLLALTGALIVVAGAAPATSGAVGRSFFGMQAWTPPSDPEFARMGGAKVGTFRFNLTWSAIEPTPGERRWGDYDRIVAATARSRIRLLPVLYGSPAFVASRETKPPSTPAGREAFAAFIRDAVARYGRNGAFWRANPSVPYRPIEVWQILNEPNFPSYSNGAPSPRKYASLLELGWRAVKARDSRAKVVMAGLPESALGVPMARFLRGLYRVRGIKRFFDVVAIHPYARDQRGALGAVIRARRIMGRARDGRTPLWLTEVGWGTAGNGSRAFRTTKRGQAQRLTNTYRTMLKVRRRYRIGMVVWFSWRDRPLYGAEPNRWFIHTGLFTKSGSAKPAWTAYKRVARRGS